MSERGAPARFSELDEDRLDNWMAEMHAEYMDQFGRLRDAVDRVDYAGPEEIIKALEEAHTHVEALEDLGTEWRGVLDFLETVQD